MMGMVGGQPIKLLVDTGAAVTLVNYDVIKNVSPKIRPTKRKIVGVTGAPLDVKGEAELELTINGLVTNHNCLVVGNMKNEAIIGYDLLKEEGYTLDFSEPGKAERGKRQTACVRLPCEVHIPAYTRKFVRMKPSRRLDLCLEARVEPATMPSPGVWAEDAVSTIDSEGRILVSVVNTTACGITLARRTRVANVFSFQGERVNHIKVVDWISACLESHDESLRCGNVAEMGGGEECFPEKDNEKRRAEEIFSKMELTSLTQKQKQIVQKLVQQYSRSFALDGEPLTATPLTKYRVPTGNAAPIRKRAYRLPECHKEPLKELLKNLQNEGVIAPSKSEWSAPILLVPKGSSGAYRLVTDYRALNKVLTKDAYPLPRIHDLLDNLKGARHFTVLDMKQSYYQFEIAEEDRHKTAFVCCFGLFEYLRMCMGMSRSTSCIQRVLETLFADMKDEVAVFIDDIIVFSEDEDTHAQAVAKVLGRLRGANLTLKPEKCQFFKSQVKYLGHLVSAEGVYPLHENIKKVLQYPVPRDVKELRSFIGLATYYRRFVKDFAKIAKPLTEMTKKGKPWCWGNLEEKAFETLKTKLVSPPILSYPRYDLPFLLQTDASDLALGGVLGQLIDGEVRVIAYGSRSLTAAEQNYSTIEKEALSIVHFVGEYRHYLLGRKFILETDHAPLSFLNKHAAEPKGRLGRWAVQLSEFDFELRYRPGRENGNADCLSRLPVTTIAAEPLAEEEGTEECISVGKIKSGQQKDEWCRSMIGYLRRNELPRGEDLQKRVVLEANRYLIRGDGVLTYLPSHKAFTAPEMGSFPVIVLPPALRDTVMTLMHDALTAGHLGFQKTLRKIQERFFWRNMYSDVEKYTKSCDSCAKIKTPPLRRRAPHAVFTCASRPMEAVQIDFIGPITPRAMDGSKHILVVTDLFTRYAEAFALPDQLASTVAKTLVTEFFCRYGAPWKIHSDRASNFKSSLIKEIMKLYEVHHVQGSSYRPQSQGSVERLNRSLVDMLKHFTGRNVYEWSSYVPYVVSAYNSAVNASTLYTPHELFYGRTARLPLDVLIHKPGPKYKDVDNYHQEVAERLHLSHQQARVNAAEARRAQAKYYNCRAKKRDFRCGDKVYITNEAKNAKRKTGTDEHGNVDSRKFRPAWIGPYTIIERKGEVVYVVKNDSSGKVAIVHEDRMKLTYHSRLERRKRTKLLNKTTAEKTTSRKLRSNANQNKKKEAESRWWDEKGSDVVSSDSSDDENQMVPLEAEGGSRHESETDSEQTNEEEVMEESDSGTGGDDGDYDADGDDDGADDDEDGEDDDGGGGGPIEERAPPELSPHEKEATPRILNDETVVPRVDLSPTLPNLSPHEVVKEQETPRAEGFRAEPRIIDGGPVVEGKFGETPSVRPKSKTSIRLRQYAPEFKPGEKWWNKLKASPKKPGPEAPEKRILEVPISDARKEELRRLLEKDWEKKIQHESKYKSGYVLSLDKHLKSEKEREFVSPLIQAAEAKYERQIQQAKRKLEVPLSDARKAELRRLFEKDWEKKIRHESKHKSGYVLNLDKHLKSEKERDFVSLLIQAAEADYERQIQQERRKLEVPLSDARKEELRRLFEKDWEKKIRHESKYKSGYVLSLDKHLKTEKEREFVSPLIQAAEANYKREIQQSYPNTRRKLKEGGIGKESVLTSQLVGKDFLRGTVRGGVYSLWSPTY